MEDNSILNEQNLNNLEFVSNYAESLDFGDLHLKIDRVTGLCAIIAIHNTKLGPALGGCRFIEYPSRGAAIVDALRLARGMTYKAAITGLPLGGGKSVIIKPSGSYDREALFSSFGQFIDTLGGRYITANDSGTSMSDMDIIAKETSYVTTTTPPAGSQLHDSSFFTARGVFRSIQAALSYRLKKDSLNGIHVALQGTGSVAYYLAKLLSESGARITACDIDTARVNAFAKAFEADIVSPEAIYDVDCDVFSPSALGAVINRFTIPRLKATVIAGCANNQLESHESGIACQQRGILYAPDYLANSGGLIFAAADYLKQDQDSVIDKIDTIYDTLLRIFTRADAEHEPTDVITSKIVEEMI